MVTYAGGDVVPLLFPFTDAVGAKQRPALILLDAGDEDMLVARITSQIPVAQYDVNLSDWQQAGLLRPSVARVHKLATLERSLVKRKLGTLTSADWTRVRERIQRLCSAISQ
ncbi:MAG: type II toxin-antitoxin system PemK/MazF family toxin [Gemmatimonadetes bacterium]|nr:type II toxin-antitoxin system PemK/MazF family toxin [Gemmatimonadota bacterium]